MRAISSATALDLFPAPAPATDDVAPPDASHLSAPSVLRAEQRLAMLREISEIGMELTRALARRVQAEEATGVGDAPVTETAKPPPFDPSDAFARLSRAVRLTLSLEARAEEALSALLAGERAATEARREARVAREKHAAETRTRDARERIEDLVEREIERTAESEEDFYNLVFALEQRLDEDQAYHDLESRPLGETVEWLCRDLCLSPDWRRWTGEGWLEDDTPRRYRFSPFNTPSRKPLPTDSG